MPRSSLTRRVRFAATHRYWRPEWDAARNASTFGACAAPEPHGHAYTCDVTVSGLVESTTGMIIDLGLLDRILHDCIVGPLHERLVNDALPEFRAGGAIPTCEELARVLAERVAAALIAAGSAAAVHRLCVAEDDTLSACWHTG